MAINFEFGLAIRIVSDDDYVDADDKFIAKPPNTRLFYSPTPARKRSNDNENDD